MAALEFQSQQPFHRIEHSHIVFFFCSEVGVGVFLVCDLLLMQSVNTEHYVSHADQDNKSKALRSLLILSLAR